MSGAKKGLGVCQLVAGAVSGPFSSLAKLATLKYWLHPGKPEIRRASRLIISFEPHGAMLKNLFCYEFL